MMTDYTFIDFDGVILDSEERMLDRKYDLGLHDHKNMYILNIQICIQKNGNIS